MRGPFGFTGGRVVEAMVSQLDVYPTLCDVAGVPQPDWLHGRSLLPLVQGDTVLHDELFTELTFHAAYDPQRAVRTERWKYIRLFGDYMHPVLPNVDDSAAKEVLVANGWADTVVDRDQLYDLVLDPAEGRNLAGDPGHAPVLADLRSRLDAWMRATNDPLLDGPVAPPVGALLNKVDQRSPDEPMWEAR